MRKLLLLLSLLAFSYSFSQANSENDSSFAKLKTDSPDTNKVVQLLENSRLLRHSNYDSSAALAQSALLLSEKIKWKKGIGLASQNLAMVSLEKGDFDLAIAQFSKAIQVWSDQLLTFSETDIRNNLSGVKEIKYQIGFSFSGMGSTFLRQGLYSKALEYHLKSLDINEDLQDQQGVSIDLGNISEVYSAQNDHKKALEYNLRALELAKKIGTEDQNLAICYGNCGNNYANLDEHQKAIEYYSEALKIGEQIDCPICVAVFTGNIGAVYEEQKEYQKALEYYNKAYTVFKEIGHTDGVIAGLCSIGSVYTKLGKYQEAEKNLLLAHSMAEQIGLIDYLLEIQLNLSDLYTAEGNYRASLEYYKKYVELKDTLFSDQKSKELLMLEVQFENRKQQEIRELSHTNEMTLLIKEHEVSDYKKYLLISIVLFACSILLFLWSRQRMKAKKQKEAFALEQKLNQTELAQIQLEKQNLEYDLQLKQEKLSNSAKLLQEKTRLLNEMEETLMHSRKSETGELSAQQLLLEAKEAIDPEKYWEQFITNFNIVYKDFLEHLTQKYPDLTRSEIRMCILLKCNLGNKEIANVLHISPDSVKKAINRMRKKFRIEATENLRKFIQQLD